MPHGDHHNDPHFGWFLALAFGLALLAAFTVNRFARSEPVRSKSVFESTVRPTPAKKLQVEPFQLAPDAGTPPAKVKPVEPRPSPQRHNQAPPRAYPRPKKLVARR